MAITLQTAGTWARTPSWVAGTLLFGGSATRGVLQFEGLPPVTDRPTAAASWSLDLDVTGISATTTLTASIVVSRLADPAATTVGSYLLDPMLTTTVTGTGPLTIGGALTGTASQIVSGSAFNRGWQATYRDSGGAFARTLILVLQTAGTLITLDTGVADLTVTEQGTRTGVSGSQYVLDRTTGEATGFVECAKSGRWVPANEAVRDGYTGALVHPDEWDPPEPKPRRARRSNQWVR